MTSDKKNVSLLADIFVKSGLKNIVISPGSRNAPIILSFANNPEINAFSIIDERSAAFFALGMALQTKQTTAIACTSGSALLNYAPAIAEAYYQKIPLLVLSADRPKHLVDVGDGQTIRQFKVFENIVKKSYELPETINDESSFNEAEILINEALNNCIYPEPGPVHINIPFDEPIYGVTEIKPEGRILANTIKTNLTQKVKLDSLISNWNSCNKVMVIAGQNQQNAKLNSTLSKLKNNSNTIVLTETTSNLNDKSFIDTIDNVVSTIKDSESNSFAPQLVITFGGQIVSKMIKKFLRNNKPDIHYRISIGGNSMDTFQCNSETIIQTDEEFFNYVIPRLTNSMSKYSVTWLSRLHLTQEKRNKYLDEIDYSDLKVFHVILSKIPENTVIHLGNSTPVRYSQLFGSNNKVNYQSNRGVSGIDGQVSTAVGYAQYSDRLNILITGDLGFLYDSNGLMNNYFTSNLKVIVINNEGGDIFRFIPGPDRTPNLEKFFVAKHEWSVEHICKAFNVGYVQCDSLIELKATLSDFLSKEFGASVLEINTPSNINSEVLRKYFSFLKG